MKSVIRIFLLIAVVISYASGQTVFTLDRCLMLARTQNPRMRNAENAIRTAELSHAELSTTKLPQIKLGASSIYAPSFGNLGYDPALSNGGQVSGQVIVQQSLYDGGIRGLKSDQLSLDIDRLAKEKRIAERDLMFSVKQAFVETLRAEQEIILQEESVQQLSEYLEIVRRLSKVGSAAYTDVLKTELQISNAQLAYQKATEEFVIAKYSLAELIGTPLDTTFNIVGSLNDTMNTEIDSPLFNVYADSLSNLEMSAASLAVKHSLMDVELTQHENYPTVLFVGDAGLLTSGDNLHLPRDERANMFGFSFGIELEIPLVNWGATDLRVQQKRLDADNLRLQSDILQRSITTESRKTRLQIMKQHERLRVIQNNIKIAEDNFFLTKSKYAGGGTLSLEVLSAQQLLTDTKLSELQTLADIRLLVAKMEQLTTQ
ncbi:MAG: TolC family protein [Bacteroidota bacterium]